MSRRLQCLKRFLKNNELVSTNNDSTYNKYSSCKDF